MVHYSILVVLLMLVHQAIMVVYSGNGTLSLRGCLKMDGSLEAFGLLGDFGSLMDNGCLEPLWFTYIVWLSVIG